MTVYWRSLLTGYSDSFGWWKQIKVGPFKYIWSGRTHKQQTRMYDYFYWMGVQAEKMYRVTLL